MKELNIKEAKPEDVSTIFSFINDLALYEKEPESVLCDEAMIHKALFEGSSTAKAVLCFYKNEPIGMAVFFYNFSTWLGKKGLYLEDLYVSEKHRGLGAGKALLKYLAKHAVKNDCGRFEWSVLDWNTPAIDFYESLGAKAQSEWLGYRLEGEALEKLAKEASTVR